MVGQQDSTKGSLTTTCRARCASFPLQQSSFRKTNHSGLLHYAQEARGTAVVPATCPDSAASVDSRVPRTTRVQSTAEYVRGGHKMLVFPGPDGPAGASSGLPWACTATRCWRGAVAEAPTTLFSQLSGWGSVCFPETKITTSVLVHLSSVRALQCFCTTHHRFFATPPFVALTSTTRGLGPRATPRHSRGRCHSMAKRPNMIALGSNFLSSSFFCSYSELPV